MCDRESDPSMHDTEVEGGAYVTSPANVVISGNRIAWPAPLEPADARRIDVMRVLGCLICLGSALAFVGLAWIALAAAGLA